MYCTYCGNSLPDNANFCHHCGIAVPQCSTVPITQAPTTPKENVHPLLNDWDPSTHVIQKPKRNKKPFIIFGICTLALLIILSPFIINGIIELFTPKTNNFYTADEVCEAYVKAIIDKDKETFSISIYPPILNNYKEANDSSTADALNEVRNDLSKLVNLSSLKYKSFEVTYSDYWGSDTNENTQIEDIVILNETYQDSPGYIHISGGNDIEGTVTFRKKDGDYFTIGWYADTVYADGHCYILDFEFESFYE